MTGNPKSSWGTIARCFHWGLGLAIIGFVHGGMHHTALVTAASRFSGELPSDSDIPTFFAEWLLYLAPMIRQGKIFAPFTTTGRHAPVAAELMY